MAYTRGTVLRTAFDSYTIKRKRAGGDTHPSEVFEVKDSDGNRRALKVLPIGKPGHPALKRSRDEFNFGFRSAHKHIAPLIDCGITGSKAAFYVMPFYELSLRDLITKGIAAENALRLFSQILDGVEAAHLHNLSHGSIKPENVFVLHESGELLVADFGIARLVDTPKASAKKSTHVIPVSPYAAPEQLPGKGSGKGSGKAPPDQKSDVYALGILLREMFLGTTAMGLGHADIADVAPSFAYLDWTIGRMTNPEPTRRLTVSEVKRELIARGHEFLSLQRLNSLKTEILREPEVDDPLLRNPITIQSVDFKGETLYLTLSTVPPANWISAFHAGDTHPAAANHGPNRFVFLGKLAHIKIARGSDPAHLLELSKVYVEAANRDYIEIAHRERQAELKEEQAKRRALIAAEERRHSVLARLRL
jgi:serine/threonine protein kinase